MEQKLHYAFLLRIYREDKVFGPGVSRLLHLVDNLGSLRMAAKEMGMAYSKAWNMIKRSEEGLGFLLLDSQTGGKKGGGANLTSEGRAFLEAFDGFERELNQQAEGLFKKYFSTIK